MNWTIKDVSTWLIENGFNKFVDKFIEEEIDGLSLLYLSSSSIEELLSVKTEDNIVKKPTIGIKTIFEKKIGQIERYRVILLDEKKSDLFIQQLQSNLSNQSLSQSSSSINSLQITDAIPNEIIHDQASNNSLTNPKSSQSRKSFPLNYILPKFDKAFQEAANDPLPSDFGTRRRKKQQLIKTIRDDVANTY
ncbi:unnamed protein product [Rotaria sp. Silwood1]|nr:unnamed protein product [Rotaria sp. Silwood1]CAF3921967.1 unnamed protein product [Rotaria sp. Silwood1]CAF4846288.1 unnamed protein product [Rotaria sp. Silwood1]CAF4877904.1 unnamed protein product [Rotaria sp. Silwood1]